MNAAIIITLITSALGAGDDRGTGDTDTLVRGCNRFALELYARRGAQEQGNLFFCPHSISSALAMTWAGARGETARQMAATLHFDLPEDRLHAAFADLRRQMQGTEGREGSGGGCELRVASRLWAQQGQTILPAFSEALGRWYQSELERVDFVASREAARRRINEWTNSQTAGHIPELLRPEHLQAAPALILTNAVYFKGPWESAFDPGNTHQAPFYPAPGASGTVAMMSRLGQVPYAETPLLQMVELPYRGEEFSMLILLPRAADGLAGLERSLDLAHLEEWIAALSPTSVQVQIPRLNLRARLELEKDLAAMGMPDAFTHRADFSGIDGTRSLYIFAVVHEATIDVDEEGTVATGATGVILGRSKGRGTVFRADHPFLITIRARKSGAILFVGRVAQPQQ